jgi:hypothetical protein
LSGGGDNRADAHALAADLALAQEWRDGIAADRAEGFHRDTAQGGDRPTKILLTQDIFPESPVNSGKIAT